MKLSDKAKHRWQWFFLLVAIGAMIYLSIPGKTTKKKIDSSGKKKISKSVKKEIKKTKTKIRVLVKEIAFRSSPGVLYGNQIDVIKEGTILTVLGKEGNWYKIKTPGKRVGYISAKQGYTEIVK